MPTTAALTCQPHRPATQRLRELAAAGYIGGGSYAATGKERTIWAAAPAADLRG